MRRVLVFLVALAAGLAALLAASTASAQLSGPMPTRAGWAPRIGERAPVDVALTDEDGRPARLRDYLSPGRPVILVMAYHDCPMLCSLVMNGLASALRKVELTPGRDFTVAVVSIDPADTPEKARAKQDVFLKQYDRPGAEPAVHFLVGGEAEVRAVARGVGFEYEYDPIGKQYGHAGGLVVLSGEGTISHYFYGVDFPPRDLRLGLVESARGAIGTATDKLLLLCFRYDPSRGKYGALALGSVRAGGVLTVIVLGVSLVWMGRRRKAALDGEGRQ